MKQRSLLTMSGVLVATCFSPLPLWADIGSSGQEVVIDLVPYDALPIEPSGSNVFDAGTVDLAALEPLAEEELADQRGGFMFEGMNVNFGAELRTYLGDELVLRTNLTVGDTVQVTQFVSPTLTAVDPSALPDGLLDTGTIKLGDSNGFYLTNDGNTALMHRFEGALQNVLLNTATGLTGRQEIDATIGLNGHEAFQAQTVSESAMGQIQSMLIHSGAGGFGH